MSNFVLDASVALQWLLEDEPGREYSLDILPRFAEQRAVVPILWCYEVANGLLVAHRRKRITFEQLRAFLERLRTFLSTSFRRRKLKSSGWRISPCLTTLRIMMRRI